MLHHEILAFIVDRQARQLSQASIDYYTYELNLFTNFLDKDLPVEQITANHIRAFFVHLGKTRNRGGIHASYRALRAFFTWWKAELKTDYNPLTLVTPPRRSNEPLPGIPLNHIELLIATCDDSFHGSRDRAIFVTLTDTGLRRAEFLALNVDDINFTSGEVQVVKGKGNKPRVVYIGNRCKRDMLRYLRYRQDRNIPLWIINEGTRLTVQGLREILRRRALKAGIPRPGVHDFRRTFALEMLRNRCDVFSLMRLMGHTSPETLQLYLRLVNSDIKAAHQRSSPMDQGRE